MTRRELKAKDIERLENTSLVVAQLFGDDPNVNADGSCGLGTVCGCTCDPACTGCTAGCTGSCGCSEQGCTNSCVCGFSGCCESVKTVGQLTMVEINNG